MGREARERGGGDCISYADRRIEFIEALFSYDLNMGARNLTGSLDNLG